MATLESALSRVTMAASLTRVIMSCRQGQDPPTTLQHAEVLSVSEEGVEGGDYARIDISQRRFLNRRDSTAAFLAAYALYCNDSTDALLAAYALYCKSFERLLRLPAIRPNFYAKADSSPICTMSYILYIHVIGFANPSDVSLNDDKVPIPPLAKRQKRNTTQVKKPASSRLSRVPTLNFIDAENQQKFDDLANADETHLHDTDHPTSDVNDPIACRISLEGVCFSYYDIMRVGSRCFEQSCSTAKHASRSGILSTSTALEQEDGQIKTWTQEGSSACKVQTKIRTASTGEASRCASTRQQARVRPEVEVETKPEAENKPDPQPDLPPDAKLGAQQVVTPKNQEAVQPDRKPVVDKLD
ncbi:hypothetical protein E2P81_ATG11157 [Venturia nashicola]|nr:hypothetical protein E2P81_ATG11157 [Venturia nashicola]